MPSTTARLRLKVFKAAIVVIVAALVAMLFGAVVTTSPASAASPAAAVTGVQGTTVRFDPVTGSSTEPKVNACGNSNSNSVNYQYPLLPLDRWGSETNDFHNRYGSNPLSDLAEKASMQGVTSLAFSAGNAIWGVTSGITNFSIQFCLLDRMGGLADNAAATIGNAILGNALLGAIIAAIIIGLLFRAFRTGENPMKSLLKKGVIVAIMAVMMLGATGSTGGGSPKDPNGAFKPGVFGPGWVAMTINKTIQNITSGPSAAMLGTTGQPTPFTITSKTTSSNNGTKITNWMSCDAYVTGLRTAYTNRLNGGTGVMDLSGSTPMILSSMWEETGLRSWRNAQFGQSSVAGGKNLDDKVWCRMLEMNADIPGMTNINGSQSDNSLAGTQRGIASAVKGWPDWTDKNDYAKNRWMSSAVRTSSNDEMDRSMIAWLACEPSNSFASDKARPGANAANWTIRPEFTVAGNSSIGDKAISPGQCVQWWALVNDPMNNRGLDWSKGVGEVSDRMPNNPATASFLNALHGQNVGGAVISGFAYVISALCILIVFGGLSVAVIFSKLGMVVMLLVIPLLFVAELLPFGNKQGSKLIDALKYFTGMSFFAAMTGLVMSFMVIVTKLLMDAGTSLASDGGEIMGLLWSGAAPLLSAVLVSLIFKKIFKAPGMFKPSSAMKWAGAAGAVGAVGGGAVGGMIGGNMMRSAMSQAGRRATDGVLGKVGLGPRASVKGGRNERIGASTMDPAPKPKGPRAIEDAEGHDEKRISGDIGLSGSMSGPREGDIAASLTRREKAAALTGAGAGALAAGVGSVAGAASDGQARQLAKLNAGLGDDEKRRALSGAQKIVAGAGGIAAGAAYAAKRYAGTRLDVAKMALAAGARSAKENPALFAKRLGAGAVGAGSKVAKTSMLVGAAAIGTALAPGVAVPLLAGAAYRKTRRLNQANRAPGAISARQSAYERYNTEVKEPMLEQLRESQAQHATGSGKLDQPKADLLNTRIKRMESGRASVPLRASERAAMLSPTGAEAKVHRGQRRHAETVAAKTEEKAALKAAKEEAYHAPREARLRGTPQPVEENRPLEKVTEQIPDL